MKNPFAKFVIRDKKEEIFHSSEYGRAQSGEAMGATSAVSFDMRMEMEKNRQIVRRYNDSRVAEQRFNGGVRAKEYVVPEKKESLGVKKLDNGSVRGAIGQSGAGKNFTPPAYKNRFGK